VRLPRIVCALLALAAFAPACATTTTSSTTWTAQPGPGWARPGRVESVTEMTRRVQGDPIGGAVAGALIGGFLFGGGRGPGTLFGAAAGAAVGASASQGASESRTYHVAVRFDDGEYGVFVYAAPPPFRPGDRIVLTDRGLAPGY
jgi:outer membrane lipoprotein SlyB